MSVGDVLSGKYRVERVIGEGGMGVVVAATHLQLQERVALKFLLLEVSAQSETVARFLREAQAAVKIKSEHVARVSDVGTLESGAPYMVMEYLDGHDLAAHLVRHGALPAHEVVEFVLQTCEAIAEAHRAGIIHRDLKPANLFLVERADGSPCVKVLDFGISKITGDGFVGGDKGLTKSTGIMGTPHYMSPEQLRSSRDVDARTDVWSLGVILFELLTGVLPFDEETVPDLCVSILTKPAPRLSDKKGDIDPGLEAVVAKCLKKDSSDRYASVGELASALTAFAPDHARASIDRIVRTSHGAWRPKIDVQIPGPAAVRRHPSGAATEAAARGVAARKARESAPTAPAVPTPGEDDDDDGALARPASRWARYAIAGGIVAIAGAVGLLFSSSGSAVRDEPKASASVSQTAAAAPSVSAPTMEVSPAIAVAPSVPAAPVEEPTAPSAAPAPVAAQSHARRDAPPGQVARPFQAAPIKVAAPARAPAPTPVPAPRPNADADFGGRK